MDRGLNRPGWRLGVAQRHAGQIRRVPIFHTSRLAMWAHGRTEADRTANAQYVIDEFYVKRRIQLDELICQDDVDPHVRILPS